MLSLIPPFLLLTIVVFATLIGVGEGRPRDHEVALAREMMQVHSLRTLEARSNEFNGAVADMGALPAYPVRISTSFVTEIVDVAGVNWIITWPREVSVTDDKARAINGQLQLLGYRTPGRSSINDFNGPYDALNGRIDDTDIPATTEAIPDLFPVIASRYDP